MPPIINQIRNAIRPLTDDPDVKLHVMRYGTHYQQIEFVLVTDSVSITFHGFNDKDPKIRCIFTVHPIGKAFYGHILFPALGLDIPSPLGDPQAVSPPSDFFSDLNHVCKQIRKNRDPLFSAFSEETIDNTIRIYSEEFRKWDKKREIFPPVPSSAARTDAGVETRKIDDECIDRILADYKMLEKKCHRLTISCGFSDNSMDLSFYSYISMAYARYLIHKESTGIALYFILDPRDFLKGTAKQTNLPMVFSYRNVFRLLEIDYPYRPKGTLEDVREFFQVIQDNSDKIFPVFSRERLENTYHALKDTTGNNEHEIREVLKNLVELVD